MNENKPPRLGLRGFWKERRNNGQKFRYKLQAYLWELRYAFRRAWIGYDDRNIFELGAYECARLEMLLATFADHHDEIVDDPKTGEVARRIAKLLHDSDEDRIFDTMYPNITPGYQQIIDGLEIQRKKLEEAFTLFGQNVGKFWY